MSQNRVGIIAHVDREKKCGIILDENCQDISFKIDDFSNPIVDINVKVSFEIELNNDGLTAINVFPIH